MPAESLHKKHTFQTHHQAVYMHKIYEMYTPASAACIAGTRTVGLTIGLPAGKVVTGVTQPTDPSSKLLYNYNFNVLSGANTNRLPIIAGQLCSHWLGYVVPHAPVPAVRAQCGCARQMMPCQSLCCASIKCITCSIINSSSFRAAHCCPG